MLFKVIVAFVLRFLYVCMYVCMWGCNRVSPSSAANNFPNPIATQTGLFISQATIIQFVYSYCSTLATDILVKLRHGNYYKSVRVIAVNSSLNLNISSSASDAYLTILAPPSCRAKCITIPNVIISNATMVIYDNGWRIKN